MAAPKIYRSTDTNAPTLTAGTGSLRQLLQACLVDGYGSTRATATITTNGTTVSDGDTITIDGITYTWKTTLSGVPGQVLIGASAATNLSNLAAAIGTWGASGTNYIAGTTVNTTGQSRVQATSVTTTVLTLTALKGGTGGNSIALSKSAANITLSGATFSGGSGTDTTASLGWTMPYTSTAGYGAAFRAAGGMRMYFAVIDDGVLAGVSRDAAVIGYETMSAWATGTGPFPSTAVGPISSTNLSGYGGVSTGFCAVRKCGATADSTAKPWLLIGDDRTFYLFVLTGDIAGGYIGFGYGDFYSYVAADPFKCGVYAGNASQTTGMSIHPFGTQSAIESTTVSGHFVPRNFAGLGGSTALGKGGDYWMGNASVYTGTLGFPNPSDGGLYLAPIRLIDSSTPGGTLTGTLNLRGKHRGLYHCVHAASFFADGDTVNGTGAYAGRTFMFVKSVFGGISNGLMVVETTAWDISP